MGDDDRLKKIKPISLTGVRGLWGVRCFNENMSKAQVFT